MALINNIDEPATILKNLSVENGAHYLKIRLEGPDKNSLGIGIRVQIKSDGIIQTQELILSRGFQSSVDPVILFGINEKRPIEEVRTKWPDGKEQIIKNVSVNQEFIIRYEDSDFPKTKNHNRNTKCFQNITSDLGLDFIHKENVFDDYKYERLLPHQYSRNGPGLAVGDVNADGLEDLFIGGATGQSGVLIIQQPNGKFKNVAGPWDLHEGMEDLDAVFFDADKDGDMDLYVVSGGNESVSLAKYKDRMYVNQGSGQFEYDGYALPNIHFSGSRVRIGDFDKDGDDDLFVGGRIVPRSYPLPASSYILENNSNKSLVRFKNITPDVCVELDSIGLVTDAVWMDYNNDQSLDLIVVGEWMPITVFRNEGSVFTDATHELGLSNTVGWWYSLVSEDFDGDGYDDLVAGNLGLNYKYKANEEESFDVYFNDYDNNGNHDIVFGYYQNGIQYPLRGRQCSSEQIPTIKYKYKNYNSFASATLVDVYTTQDLNNSLHLKAYTFTNSYLKNESGKRFTSTPLPNEVQVSSINSIISKDFNRDGNLDLLLAGNLYSSEVETPRNDASYGAYLEGDGKGSFIPIPFEQSGFFINGEVKDMNILSHAHGELVIAALNNDSLKVFKIQ